MDEGADHFQVAQLFCPDVGEQPLEFGIGHGIALTEVAQGCTQLSVRTTVLTDDD